MKRFLLLMLCLSGLLACSKDKTEDVPPVPPGSEEIPDKLELKAGDTDFNSLAYTVTAGKDGNEYLHVVYDKSFYDGVVGVFYQPADLLQKDGKRGTGTQSYTVKNGDAYPDGTTIFILGKADYVILAAVCDEKGVIKGEITSVSVTTKEVEYSKAQIVVVCASDDDYAEAAPKVKELLGGKAILVVAGAPACAPELEAQGITNFINVKSNVLETLKFYLKEMGI